jgi:hypothetical protein
MANSGYSDIPLINKLGIKPEMKILLINAPENYFALLGDDIGKQITKSKKVEFVHLFVITKTQLEKQFHQIIKKVPLSTIVWISWYKKSAKMQTDITEDTIRDIVLPLGWVDIKVCAVSELWSGLKIVKRKPLKNLKVDVINLSKK